MDDSIRKRKPLPCQQPKRGVVILGTNSCFADRDDRIRSKMRLPRAMSTIVEENPQIRDVKQNVLDLLDVVGRKIRRCESGGTSLGSTPTPASSTTSHVSSTTPESDPSATSHDIESLTFCSSRKSRSFHFTTSKQTTGDVDDDFQAIGHIRRMKKYAFAPKAFTKKSLSNSDLYKQDHSLFPVFPVDVQVPRLQYRCRPRYHSQKFQRGRDVLYRPPIIMSSTLQKAIQRYNAKPSEETTTNSTFESNPHPNAKERTFVRGRHDAKSSDKRCKHLADIAENHDKVLKVRHSKSRSHKKCGKCRYRPPRPDATDDKPGQCRDMSSRIRDRKHSDENHKDKLPKKGDSYMAVSGKRYKRPQRSRPSTPEKVVEVLKSPCLNENPVSKPACKASLEEVLSMKQTKTVVFKGDSATKKRKEKESNETEKCDGRKRAKREGSLVRIKQSILNLAGFSKLGAPKKLKSKTNTRVVDNSSKPCRDLENVPNPKLHNLQVYTVTCKVPGASHMKRFLDEEHADMYKLCNCEPMKSYTKSKPTITRAELGSLDIPPFKMRYKKRESRQRARKHQGKEYRISRIDTGTMPHYICQYNRKIQATLKVPEKHKLPEHRELSLPSGDGPALFPCPVEQPNLGSVTSSYDSHETPRQCLTTSITSLADTSNRMMISEIGTVDDKPQALTKNEDPSMMNAFSDRNTKSPSHLKKIVESLCVTPNFDNCPAFLMEPYCYMTLNSPRPEQIESKATNTDLTWTNNEMQVDDYCKAIQESKPLIEQKRRCRTNYFSFVKGPKYDEDVSSSGDVRSTDEKPGPRSKIPVFSSDKRILPGEKAETHSLDASSFIDNKSNMKASRIPRPKMSRNLQNIPECNHHNGDGSRVVSESNHLNFELDSALLTGWSQSKDLLNLEEEKCDFYWDDDDVKPDANYVSQGSTKSKVKEDEDHENERLGCSKKPHELELSDIPTSFELKACCSISHSLAQIARKLSNPDRRYGGYDVQADASITDVHPTQLQCIYKTNSNDTLTRQESSLCDLRQHLLGSVDPENFAAVASANKMFESDYPQQDSKSQCIPCMKSSPIVLADRGSLRNVPNRKYSTPANTATIIVDVSELDEKQRKVFKSNSKAVIADSLRKINSKINLEDAVIQSEIRNMQSVSLQVLVPSNHVDTSTSSSNIRTNPTKKRSNWKSKLPLPIQRIKRSVRNTYTFPIEVNLAKLCSSENSGSDVSGKCRSCRSSRCSQTANHSCIYGQSIGREYLFKHKHIIDKSSYRKLCGSKVFSLRWWRGIFTRRHGSKHAPFMAVELHQSKFTEILDIPSSTVGRCLFQRSSSLICVSLSNSETVTPVLHSLSLGSIPSSQGSSDLWVTRTSFIIQEVREEIKQIDNDTSQTILSEDVEEVIAVTEYEKRTADRPQTTDVPRRKKTLPTLKTKSCGFGRMARRKGRKSNQKPKIIFDVPPLPEHNESEFDATRERIHMAHPELPLDMNREAREEVQKKLHDYDEQFVQKKKDAVLKEDHRLVERQIKHLNQEAEQFRDGYDDIYTPITRCDYGMTYYNFKSTLRNFMSQMETLRILTPCVKGHMQKAPSEIPPREIIPILIHVESQTCEKDITTLVGGYIFQDLETIVEDPEHKIEADSKTKAIADLHHQEKFGFEIYPEFGFDGPVPEIEPLQEARPIEPVCSCGDENICKPDDYEKFAITLNPLPGRQVINVIFEDVEYKICLPDNASAAHCVCVGETAKLTICAKRRFLHNLYKTLRKNSPFLRKVRKVLIYPTNDLLGDASYQDLARQFIQDVRGAILEFDEMYYFNAVKFKALELKWRNLCLCEFDDLTFTKLETIKEESDVSSSSKDTKVESPQVLEGNDSAKSIEPLARDIEDTARTEILFESDKSIVKLDETSFTSLLSLHSSRSCTSLEKLAKSTSIETLQSPKSSKSCICLSERKSVEKRKKRVCKRSTVKMASGDAFPDNAALCQRTVYCHQQNFEKNKKKSSCKGVELEQYYTANNIIPGPVVHYYYSCHHVVTRHPPILWVLAKRIVTRHKVSKCKNKDCNQERSHHHKSCDKTCSHDSIKSKRCCSRKRRPKKKPKRQRQPKKPTSSKCCGTEREHRHRSNAGAGSSRHERVDHHQQMSRTNTTTACSCKKPKKKKSCLNFQKSGSNKKKKNKPDCGKTCADATKSSIQFRVHCPAPSNGLVSSTSASATTVCSSAASERHVEEKSHGSKTARRHSAPAVSPVRPFAKRSCSSCYSASSANTSSATVRPNLQDCACGCREKSSIVLQNEERSPTPREHPIEKCYCKPAKSNLKSSSETNDKLTRKCCASKKPDKNKRIAQNAPSGKSSEQSSTKSCLRTQCQKRDEASTEQPTTETNAALMKDSSVSAVQILSTQPACCTSVQLGTTSLENTYTTETPSHPVTTQTMIYQNEPMVSMSVLTDETVMMNQESETCSFSSGEVQTLLSFKPSNTKRTTWLKKMATFRKAHTGTHTLTGDESPSHGENLPLGTAQTTITLLPTLHFPHALFGARQQRLKGKICACRRQKHKPLEHIMLPYLESGVERREDHIDQQSNNSSWQQSSQSCCSGSYTSRKISEHPPIYVKLKTPTPNERTSPVQNPDMSKNPNLLTIDCTDASISTASDAVTLTVNDVDGTDSHDMMQPIKEESYDTISQITPIPEEKSVTSGNTYLTITKEMSEELKRDIRTKNNLRRLYVCTAQVQTDLELCLPTNVNHSMMNYFRDTSVHSKNMSIKSSIPTVYRLKARHNGHDNGAAHLEAAEPTHGFHTEFKNMQLISEPLSHSTPAPLAPDGHMKIMQDEHLRIDDQGVVHYRNIVKKVGTDPETGSVIKKIEKSTAHGDKSITTSKSDEFNPSGKETTRSTKTTVDAGVNTFEEYVVETDPDNSSKVTKKCIIVSDMNTGDRVEEIEKTVLGPDAKYFIKSRTVATGERGVIDERQIVTNTPRMPVLSNVFHHEYKESDQERIAVANTSDYESIEPRKKSNLKHIDDNSAQVTLIKQDTKSIQFPKSSKISEKKSNRAFHTTNDAASTQSTQSPFLPYSASQNISVDDAPALPPNEYNNLPGDSTSLSSKRKLSDASVQASSVKKRKRDGENCCRSVNDTQAAAINAVQTNKSCCHVIGKEKSARKQKTSSTKVCCAKKVSSSRSANVCSNPEANKKCSQRSVNVRSQADMIEKSNDSPLPKRPKRAASNSRQQKPIKKTARTKKKCPSCVVCKKKKIKSKRFNDCCDERIKKAFINESHEEFESRHDKCCMPAEEVKQAVKGNEKKRSTQSCSNVKNFGWKGCCGKRAKSPKYVFNDCCDDDMINDFYHLGMTKFTKLYPQCCWPKLLSPSSNHVIDTDFEAGRNSPKLDKRQVPSSDSAKLPSQYIFNDCCDQETIDNFHKMGLQKFKKMYPQCCWPRTTTKTDMETNTKPVPKTVVINNKSREPSELVTKYEYILKDCCGKGEKTALAKLGYDKFAQQYPECCLPEKVEARKSLFKDSSKAIQKACKKCCAKCKKPANNRVGDDPKKLHKLFQDTCSHMSDDSKCCDRDPVRWQDLVKLLQANPDLLKSVPVCCNAHARKLLRQAEERKAHYKNQGTPCHPCSTPSKQSAPCVGMIEDCGSICGVPPCPPSSQLTLQDASSSNANSYKRQQVNSPNTSMMSTQNFLKASDHNRIEPEKEYLMSQKVKYTAQSASPKVMQTNQTSEFEDMMYPSIGTSTKYEQATETDLLCACKQKETATGEVVRIKSGQCICECGPKNKNTVRSRCQCKKDTFGFTDKEVCVDNLRKCPCQKPAKSGESATYTAVDVKPLPKAQSLLDSNFSILEQIDTYFGPAKALSEAYLGKPIVTSRKLYGGGKSKNPMAQLKFNNILPQITKQPTKLIRALNPFSHTKQTKSKQIVHYNSIIDRIPTDDGRIPMVANQYSQQVMSIHSEIQVREDSEESRMLDGRRKTISDTHKMDEKNIKFLDKVDMIEQASVKSEPKAPTQRTSVQVEDDPTKEDSLVEIKVESATPRLTGSNTAKTFELKQLETREESPGNSIISSGAPMAGFQHISPSESITRKANEPELKPVVIVDPPSPSPSLITHDKSHEIRTSSFELPIYTPAPPIEDPLNKQVAKPKHTKSKRKKKKKRRKKRRSPMQWVYAVFFHSHKKARKRKRRKKVRHKHNAPNFLDKLFGKTTCTIVLPASHSKARTFDCGCSEARGKLCKCDGVTRTACHCNKKDTKGPNPVVGYSFVDNAKIYAENNHTKNVIRQTSYKSIFEMNFEDDDEEEAYDGFKIILEDLIRNKEGESSDPIWSVETFAQEEVIASTSKDYHDTNRLSTIVERTEYDHEFDNKDEDEDDHDDSNIDDTQDSVDEEVHRDMHDIIDIYRRLQDEHLSPCEYVKLSPNIGDRLPHILTDSEMKSEGKNIYNYVYPTTVKMPTAIHDGRNKGHMERKSSSRLLGRLMKKAKSKLSKLQFRKSKHVAAPAAESRKRTGAAPANDKSKQAKVKSRPEKTKKEEIRIGGTSYIIRSPRCNDNLQSQRTIDSDIPSLTTYDTPTKATSHKSHSPKTNMSITLSQFDAVKEVMRHDNLEQILKLQKEINYINKQISGKFRESDLKGLLDASLKVKKRLQNFVDQQKHVSSTATLTKPDMSEKCVEVISFSFHNGVKPNTGPNNENVSLENCHTCASVHSEVNPHSKEINDNAERSDSDLVEFRESIRRERERIKNEDINRRKQAFQEAMRGSKTAHARDHSNEPSTSSDTCGLFRHHTCSTCMLQGTLTKENSNTIQPEKSKSTHLLVQDLSAENATFLDYLSDSVEVLGIYVPETPAAVYPVMVPSSIGSNQTTSSSSCYGKIGTDSHEILYQSPHYTTSTSSSRQTTSHASSVGQDRALDRDDCVLQKALEKIQRAAKQNQPKKQQQECPNVSPKRGNKVIIPFDTIMEKKPKLMLVPGTQTPSTTEARPHGGNDKVRLRLRFEPKDVHGIKHPCQSYTLEKLGDSSYNTNDKEYILNVHDYYKPDTAATSPRRVTIRAKKVNQTDREFVHQPRTLQRSAPTEPVDAPRSKHVILQDEHESMDYDIPRPRHCPETRHQRYSPTKHSRKR